MPPLTSPEIDPEKLEHSCLLLWVEWLKGLFDGQDHSIGARVMTIPQVVDVVTQQGGLPQELNGLGISVIWNGPNLEKAQWEEDTGNGPAKIKTIKATFQFLVRARLAEQPAPQAAKLCMDAASQLSFLLGLKEATLPLSKKGIGHIGAKVPVMISDDSSGYAVRKVECKATIRVTLAP
ncbi:MAG: hypothetical protein IT581_13685 [Verrucomicrobiales bacterium]|nr:hypothetical protein [Verrucomicrobiales bacterium]